MDYVLNGFKLLPIDLGDGIVWFEWRTALFAYRSDSCGYFDRHELDKISSCNIHKNGLRGRSSKTFINGLGICEWLCRSFRYTTEERLRFISELKSCGLVPAEFSISLSRKELDFFSSLSYFLRAVCPSVDFRRQVPMCDKYIVDGLLDGFLVIEYDENMHYSYDSEKESAREHEIVSSGYPVVRVNDKMDIGEAIGVIWCRYINLKK